MLRVKERLKFIPRTLVLIFGLLHTKSSFKAAIVMPAVPFSAIGAVWLLAFEGRLAVEPPLVRFGAVTPGITP